MPHAFEASCAKSQLGWHGEGQAQEQGQTQGQAQPSLSTPAAALVVERRGRSTCGMQLAFTHVQGRCPLLLSCSRTYVHQHLAHTVECVVGGVGLGRDVGDDRDVLALRRADQRTPDLGGVAVLASGEGGARGDQQVRVERSGVWAIRGLARLALTIIGGGQNNVSRAAAYSASTRPCHIQWHACLSIDHLARKGWCPNPALLKPCPHCPASHALACRYRASPC